jgi:hypothetical protein
MQFDVQHGMQNLQWFTGCMAGIVFLAMLQTLIERA